MAQDKATNPYLRTKVLTASPEELRLMLFDGALKFSRQAGDAIRREDWEATYNAIVRAQKIVLELSNGLNPEGDRELYERLTAFYLYLYRRLVDANMERDPSAIDEVVGLLEYERETWQMFVKKRQELRGGRDETTSGTPATPPANPLHRIGPNAAGPAANPYAKPASGLSIQG